MAEKSDIDPFLAGLDAKIAALQQLRESYVAALSVGAIGPSAVDLGTITTSAVMYPPSVQQTPPSGPIELPTGVFRDKGLAEAIRLYLSIAKRKQTTKEIHAALIEGGLATTSEFFEQTLTGTLHRLKKAGELLRFKDGWDLASSYPESYRQRLAQAQDTTSTPLKRKPKKQARPRPKTKKKSKPETVESVQGVPLRAVG